MVAAEDDFRRKRTCELRLELDLDSDPIAGSVLAPGGAPVAFVGWLGLAAELERLRAHPSGAGVLRRTKIRPLTAAERTVANLVCEGLTNPQIGEQLGVSRRTIQGHLANVFKKIGVSSRTELAAHLLRAGLSQPEVSQQRDESP